MVFLAITDALLSSAVCKLLRAANIVDNLRRALPSGVRALRASLRRLTRTYLRWPDSTSPLPRLAGGEP